MSSFIIDRSLLNPKFEGYRLHALSQDSHILRFPLPSDHKPSQAGVSGRTLLSFQEVQSRISHNHLAVKGDRAVYVDGDGNVVLVELNSSTLKPTLRTVYLLPQFIHTSSSPEEPTREYPSIVFSSATTCFVSDGHGYLYILQLPVDGEARDAEVLGSYELEIPSQHKPSVKTSPFKIHSASEVSPNTVVCVLSSRYRPSRFDSDGHDGVAPSTSTRAEKKTQVEFDVWAVQFNFPLAPSDSIQPLGIIWHRRGEDVPILTTYDLSRQSFLLLGSCQYRQISFESATSTALQPSQPPDDLQANDNNVASAPIDVEIADPNPRPKAPPYSWTQTPDTISLAFPLPTTTPTSSIKVSFSPRALSVLVLPTSTDSILISIPLPRYPAKTLWGPINPTQSLWTFDRDADTRGGWGLLTVHLDKKDVGTRWPQVFMDPGPDDDVPETMDPSELAGILESLEKFAVEGERSQEEGGLGRGVPSLGRDEYDEEVDDAVGREVRVTWVDARGSGQGDGEAEGSYGEPSWWTRRGKDREAVVGLLSTLLPGLDGETSVVAKEQLDGVVFALPLEPRNSEVPWRWTHSATFPALSFVLASKRDTRFTYHTNGRPRLVMAFESGSQTFGGNVYLYKEPQGAASKDKWGEQSVLKVGGGEAGSVLGVGALTIGSRGVVLCLCEGEIVVMVNIW